MTSGRIELPPMQPSPPAFETAATSFGKLIKAIPASMMGCLIPRSSVILVFIGFSSMAWHKF